MPCGCPFLPSSGSRCLFPDSGRPVGLSGQERDTAPLTAENAAEAQLPAAVSGAMASLPYVDRVVKFHGVYFLGIGETPFRACGQY